MVTKLEQLHVFDVYDKIAEHFSSTRFNVWPNVKDFINSFKKNDLIVEVGCGNGKNLFNNDLRYIGIDTCSKFLEICKNKQKQNQEFIIGNILNIPLEDNICDGVLCVAVIHHLSKLEDREKAIRELIRITKPGGKILIEVWAFENTKYENQDTLVNWTLNIKNKKPEKYGRYYHLFKKDELLLIIPKNIKIINSYFIHNNYVVELSKI